MVCADYSLHALANPALADFLIQSGLASQVRFHGKRFAWFVSDVTRKDWDWLLNSCVYGSLFPTASEVEIASLREMGKRWKQYEKEGKWVYEQHAFWCTVSRIVLDPASC
jgi:hypothetical protein